MSDTNPPEPQRPYQPTSPHPFTHPAAPLFPAASPPAEQVRPGPSLAQLPGVSMAGDPGRQPLSVFFDEENPDFSAPTARPLKPGVKPPRLKRAGDNGINTLAWIATAAGVSGVAMAFLPPVQFAALTVSAIALTIAVWSYTLPGFKRRQSKVSIGAATVGLIAVIMLGLTGAGTTVAQNAMGINGHVITFEIKGTVAPADYTVTWATDGPEGAATSSEKDVELPWTHELRTAAKATGSSYSLWVQSNKVKELAAETDLSCAILVDGVASNRSKVTADGILACSFYGDLDHPENVDIKH